MKVFQVEENWTMENMRLSSRPDPEPGDGEVLIRMQASALNYRDLVVPLRGYGSRMKALPLIMLCDGCGIIDTVGKNVKRLKTGDRVCPLFFQTWLGGKPNQEKLARSLGCEMDGTMAEFMVLPEDGVALAPGHLDDIEIATLPTAGVTAWRALITEGHVKPGDKVLVQGTGGVSLFALQFAKAIGAYVIVTSSSDDKLKRVKKMGADETINYRTYPDWGKRAREIADNEGVDHIVEVGGQETLPQSLRAIRTGGVISMIGVLSGGTMNASLGMIVTRHIRMQGITVGSGDDLKAMVSAINHQKLRPVIDRVFAFDELRQALDYLSNGKHFGKIGIKH